MAHGTVEFFNPTCPITVGADWDFQTCGPKQTATNYANELGQHGDELRHATHGKPSTAIQTPTARQNLRSPLDFCV